MKKMMIIGAGISGLATGCYAQMNGFEVEIYEMHNLPGGVCTTWERNGYQFDHCLHWVLGTNASNSMFPIFEELGVGKEIQYYQSERFRRIEAFGKSLSVYTNIHRFENELLRLFPEESTSIAKMCRLVRFYTGFTPPMDSDFGNFTLKEILKMLPFMPSFFRLKNNTIQEYFQIFRDAQLRAMLFRMFPVQGMPALMAILPMAFFHQRAGGYPMGGSLYFSRKMEQRLIELGGKVHYGQKIKSILVKGNKASGIETLDGQRIEGDIVVSACDGRTTLFELLEGRFMTEKITRMYEQPKLWPPLVSISFGVNRDLCCEAELTSVRLEHPVQIAGKTLEWIDFAHYCHDPSFAPKGKSAVKVQLETDYSYWKELYKDKQHYEQEKRKVLDQVVEQLEIPLPGFRSQIEVTDVATPVTWERYTGNWQGSYQGWMPSLDLFGVFLPRQLPGLADFFMTGQWSFVGGGVPMCMMQARKLIKEICRQERKPFVSWKNPTDQTADS